MEMNKSNLEPGYKAVLVREETKRKLQDFRKNIPEKDLFQERRLATAALEYCLNDETAKRAMLEMARHIVMLDLETTRP
jgi:hypothetical protein